ncbi:hypothetical protein EZV73_27510 [Acidaminobacter sp. JC074]|uniref:YciI family protein n=1 Tax=Acidaminobacter sp. JC074 TaxID=2530199 RepID=UPI001F0D2E4C|nr:YciI family protein [Acidaminobacter sp. JC074]MCH4891349.1 hypothetical protein [Acidaminobacter sp. JC074]
MKRYLVIGCATCATHEFMKSQTDEDRKELMNRWMTWKEKYQENVVDMGSPLLDGTSVNVDGMYDSYKQIAGYMMIQAEDKEAALTVLEASPLYDFKAGAYFEIFECMM